MLFLFVPLMVVWYFLLIRPQRQQMKKREETLKAIRRGDQVVTGGGVLGKVTKVIDDNELEVEIADGVRVRVVRAQVSDVRVKGEPVKADSGN
jgi:preprotein translocase subunit YajC